jgi:hypothetical protein
MKRTSTMIRCISVLALTGLLLTGLVATAAAHENREVEGEFNFVVGFSNEPAYVNQMNGLELRIFYLNGDDEEPVEGAEQSLQAEIQYGGESQELELRGVFGEPGHYTADVIPTSTGAYTFQITGDIDGTEIDETFTGGPDTFSEVAAIGELQFPANGEGNGDSSSADGTDQTAAIAIAGVVAGLLGLVAGGAAYYKVSSAGGPNPAQKRREQRIAQQRQQQQQGAQES